MKFFIPFKEIYILFKNKIILLGQVISAFLIPIKALIFLLFFMIVIDTITGLYKARKTKETITSRKLSKIVSKMVLYQLGLITFFVLDFFLFGEIILKFVDIQYFLTKVVAIFFASIELVSINENINQACGINLFKTFKQYLLRIKEVKNEIDEVNPNNHL
jgi:phage-related holin